MAPKISTEIENLNSRQVVGRIKRTKINQNLNYILDASTRASDCRVKAKASPIPI